jgi:hypothetical protein
MAGTDAPSSSGGFFKGLFNVIGPDIERHREEEKKKKDMQADMYRQIIQSDWATPAQIDEAMAGLNKLYPKGAKNILQQVQDVYHKIAGHGGQQGAGGAAPETQATPAATAAAAHSVSPVPSGAPNLPPPPGAAPIASSSSHGAAMSEVAPGTGMTSAGPRRSAPLIPPPPGATATDSAASNSLGDLMDDEDEPQLAQAARAGKIVPTTSYTGPGSEARMASPAASDQQEAEDTGTPAAAKTKPALRGVPPPPGQRSFGELYRGAIPSHSQVAEEKLRMYRAEQQAETDRQVTVAKAQAAAYLNRQAPRMGAAMSVTNARQLAAKGQQFYDEANEPIDLSYAAGWHGAEAGHPWRHDVLGTVLAEPAPGYRGQSGYTRSARWISTR